MGPGEHPELKRYDNGFGRPHAPNAAIVDRYHFKRFLEVNKINNRRAMTNVDLKHRIRGKPQNQFTPALAKAARAAFNQFGITRAAMAR